VRPETIVIHSGYEDDPTAKAVTVPIYQTVPYAFDSANDRAAPFNLEVEGYRYGQIAPFLRVACHGVAALLWNLLEKPLRLKRLFQSKPVRPDPMRCEILAAESAR
jgi:cystathionine beta-lyase/cystathionine gamma-synthase